EPLVAASGCRRDVVVLVGKIAQDDLQELLRLDALAALLPVIDRRRLDQGPFGAVDEVSGSHRAGCYPFSESHLPVLQPSLPSGNNPGPWISATPQRRPRSERNFGPGPPKNSRGAGGGPGTGNRRPRPARVGPGRG